MATVNTSDDDLNLKDGQKRQQFGNRFLTDPQNVFEHNAWDNVVWDEEQELEARRLTEEQIKHPVDQETQDKYETEAGQYWDKFYDQHQNKFFKDRHWLFTEFPELSASGTPGELTGDNKDLKVTQDRKCTANTDTFPGESAKVRMLEVTE